MKAWLRRVYSAICASVLTFSLTVNAYAETENQALPEEAPTQIVEPDKPADADELSASETQTEEGQDADAAPEESAAFEAPAEEPPADTPASDAGPADETAQEELPEEDAAAESGLGEEVKDETLPENDAEEEIPAEELVLPAESEEAAEEELSVMEEAADPSAGTEGTADETVEETLVGEQEGSDEAADQPSEASSDNSLSRTDSGVYVLVNHSGEEKLDADGDITILAAGVNRLSSISGTGKVRIAGTGILLVDEIKGSLDLLTLTDIYDKGSVAVFVRQADGSYLLVNGSIPGILDEEYRIEGCTLVIPKDGSLLLCGTGAEPLSDGSVAYYHGADHDYQAADTDQVMEMTGKLTIAEKAALIIQKGASVILENLKSLGGTAMGDAYRRPELVTESGGRLTVEGTVGSGGIIDLGEDSVLSGSGSITTDKLSIGDPSVLASSHVSLAAKNLFLYGSGEVAGLTIHDTTVHLEGGSVNLSGLASSGDSRIILHRGTELNISKLDGTLAFRANYDYYSGRYDDVARCVLSGDVQGSGTIRFESGIFEFQAGMKLNQVGVSDAFAAFVYDYAGALDPSRIPLRMQPENVPSRIESDGAVSIPISAAVYEETALQFCFQLAESMELPDFLPSLAVRPAGQPGESSTVVDLDELKDAIENYPYSEYSGSDKELSPTIELLFKDPDGTLRTEFLSLSELHGEIGADDLYLIRVVYSNPWQYVEPDSPSTMTGMNYTGSGILGGAGAGSVHFGSTDLDSQPDPDPQPEPDPQPDPKPQPEEEEKPETSSDSRDAATLQVWATWEGDAYLLHAKLGERILSALDTDVDVFMDYTPTEQTAGKPLYAVFRGADGRLCAFRASYGQLTGILHFRTDQLGRFVVVGFEFDGEEFSDAFYSALEACAEIAALN